MKRRWSQRFRLLALAFLIDVIIVVVGNAAMSLAIGAPIIEGNRFGSIDAPDVAVLHLLFTGLPMIVLAARGDRRFPMWVTAVVLSLLSWAYAVWQLHQDYLANFEGGANIGLGLIMMAAPFGILLVLKLMSLGLRRRENRTAG